MDMEIESEKEDEEINRPMKDPGAPTTSEVEQHVLSHIPCPHCVAGRARPTAHRRRTAPPNYKVPHVVVDYCFLSGDQDS